MKHGPINIKQIYICHQLLHMLKKRILLGPLDRLLTNKTRHLKFLDVNIVLTLCVN